YRDLGDQAAFAAVGLSNFYFLDNSGYFSRAADLLPLLHTWSLAVEEQFYLLWPPLLLGFVKLGMSSKRTIVALSGLIVLSLTLSAIVVADDRQAAFFMLHTRAWELALGGLLTYVPAIRRAALANLTGLGLVVLSAVLLKDGSTFPGA